MPYHTRQQAVLRCLEQRREESLSAAELAEELRRLGCAVGLATIYRQLEKLVAHPETLYHESVLSPHGVYTFPLLFGLLFFSLTRRTPSLEDLSVVQQYFDKFLCELAQEA